jgi:N-acetylmuramoyl-L-alanine amidase
LKLSRVFPERRNIVNARGHLFIIAIILFVSGCATAPSSLKTSGADYNLKDLCSQYNISCQFDSISQAVTLKKQDIEARVLAGNNYAVIDGKHVMLSRPVRISRGAVLVPYDFYIKIIQPIVSSISPATYRFQKIMIDPGHGGKDPGGIGITGVKEKDIVLDVSKRLRRALEERGVLAVLTRESDRFLELGERTSLAQTQGVDLFISIHANIEKSHRVAGVEVFYLKPLDDFSVKQVYGSDQYRPLFRNFSMKQNDPLLERTLIDLLYVNKHHESYRLAQHLACRLSQDTQTSSRGHKAAEFYVLKHTLIPSVLVEVGFLSHYKEESRLNQASERQRIADSLACALLSYGEEN